MARKKGSGFGNPKSLSFKGVKAGGGNNRIDKIQPLKAAGIYPSDRQYGTLVSRTVIERYDAESDWIRWRKGYEYYAKAAYESLIQYDPVSQEYVEARLKTQLYRGTAFELDVTFYGWRVSTRDSDSANHYVMKRTAKLANGEDPELFFVTKTFLDNTEAKGLNEFWVQGTLGKDSAILARSIGERITDGKTEATLTYFLNEKQYPAVYMGKTTQEDLTQIKVKVNYDEAASTPFIQERNGDVRAYIGQVAMLPKVYNLQAFTAQTDAVFEDGPAFFSVTIDDHIIGEGGVGLDGFQILDNTETNLPPSLYDLAELEPIFITNTYDGNIKGKYEFQKSDYQRFYGDQYMTADLVKDQINEIAYPTLPFLIQDLKVTGDILEFTAVPFLSTLNLYSIPPQGTGYLVFADYSFTETMLDTYDGQYRHPINGPYDSVFDQIAADNAFSKLVWYKKINDVDPYIGFKGDFNTLVPVFNDPTAPLRLAEVYSCSCPSYSQAMLRMPQTTQGPEQRKVNRQRNYPLPTALGKKDYESIGTDSAAGVMQTWQNSRAAASFKLCKHTIASMFDEHLKLQEPNTYQTLEAREEFGAKLAADIKEVPQEFYESYARGGINTLEIVFALAEGLGYDDVETAYLVLNAKF